jgi:hypothetical protein
VLRRFHEDISMQIGTYSITISADLVDIKYTHVNTMVDIKRRIARKSLLQRHDPAAMTCGEGHNQ